MRILDIVPFFFWSNTPGGGDNMLYYYSQENIALILYRAKTWAESWHHVVLLCTDWQMWNGDHLLQESTSQSQHYGVATSPCNLKIDAIFTKCARVAGICWIYAPSDSQLGSWILNRLYSWYWKMIPRYPVAVADAVSRNNLEHFTSTAQRTTRCHLGVIYPHVH